jgi:peptidoglycan/LPS O-acetylase OafA/YrhL
MKSSEGVHFVGLDHVRAIAVFLVFGHHVMMASLQAGAPLPDRFAFFGYSMISQGHTGVALFMALSGYLFARLSDGREVDRNAFLLNRGLRLGPLLLLVLVIAAIPTVVERPEATGLALLDMVAGLVYPIWPNGGWSIAVELHFYLLFPFLLMLMRRSLWWLIAVPLAAMALRGIVFNVAPDRVQDMAYWTIFGRIDQFALGMAAARAGHWMAGRHLLAAAIGSAFMLAMFAFDLHGGFSKPLELAGFWVVWPMIEGITYALLIAWYDRSFQMPDTGVSKAIAKIGQWSFSIYLLHFFFVWRAVGFIHMHVVPIGSFAAMMGVAVVGFVVMLVPAALSFRFIESPFLKRRIRYLVPLSDKATARAGKTVAAT